MLSILTCFALYHYIFFRELSNSNLWLFLETGSPVASLELVIQLKILSTFKEKYLFIEDTPVSWCIYDKQSRILIFFLLCCEIWESNSGIQACTQIPLPTEPSHWPTLSFWRFCFHLRFQVCAATPGLYSNWTQSFLHNGQIVHQLGHISSLFHTS